VAFSTINVELRPSEAARTVVQEPWSPAGLARGSARSLVAALQALSGLGIFFVIVVLPMALVVGIPAWGMVMLWQGFDPRRAGRSPGTARE